MPLFVFACCAAEEIVRMTLRTTLKRISDQPTRLVAVPCASHVDLYIRYISTIVRIPHTPQDTSLRDPCPYPEDHQDDEFPENKSTRS